MLDISFIGHIPGFHFTRLLAPFTVQKVVSFMVSHLAIAGLNSWANRFLVRKSFSIPLSCIAECMFSSSNFSVSRFTLRSLTHLGYAFVKSICMRGTFHVSTCSYPVFLTPLIGNAIFSSAYVLGIFVKY